MATWENDGFKNATSYAPTLAVIILRDNFSYDNKVRQMRGILILFFGAIFSIGCSERQPDKTTTEKFENEITGQIRNLWRTDTLTLFARYDECGEWGGHIETFKIYNKSNTDLWFDYRRDTVDCSGDIHGSRKWINNFSDKLTNDNQKKIIEYIHDMLDESFKEKFIMHSGQYFSISNSDSTIIIANYVPRHEGFLKLRRQLVK